jgi:hypothetical protein
MNPGRAVVRYNAKAVTATQEIVALAARHLSFGLARLGFESRLLTLDPSKLANHRQPHGLVAEP